MGFVITGRIDVKEHGLTGVGFTGIGSFAHLKHVKCLTTPSELYDIAIIGAPFDTAVSYRPGKLSLLPPISHQQQPPPTHTPILTLVTCQLTPRQ